MDLCVMVTFILLLLQLLKKKICCAHWQPLPSNSSSSLSSLSSSPPSSSESSSSSLPVSSSDSQLFPPLLSKEEKRRGGFETQIRHQNSCSGRYIGSETPNFLVSFSVVSKPAARSNSEEARQQLEMQRLEVKQNIFQAKRKMVTNTASLLLEG